MVRRKFRFLVAVITVFILTFGLVGPALAAGNPEPGGGARWIVQFEEGVNLPAKQMIIEHAGGVIDQELDALNMAIVFLPSQAASRAIEKEKGVRWVEEDSYKYYDSQPLPWGIDRIDAEVVWPAGTGNTGAGVKVAVLDSGIDMDHLDLLAGGYSAVNRDTTNFEDKNGHGTHVAGIIAALNNSFGVVGVGPAIDLYAVQISKGARIRLTDILEGINWSVANNMQVINMSFGGGYSKSEDTALQIAYNNGIVLVSSAGNASGGAVNYPAKLSQVIAVSAVDKYDQIASFSSIGSEVELAAPGVSIYSTYKGNSYATMSGTSMAAPHVVGVAALVIASGITDTSSLGDPGYGLINDEVRVLLNTTAEDLGALGKDNLYGHGLVDAENAVLGTTTGNNLVVDTGSIGGTVTDSTSAAIDGATVTVEGTSLSATTDTNGDYIISGVPVGTYTVTASAGGYQSQSANNVAVTKDVTTTVNFALSQAAEPTGTMHVAAISYDTSGGRNGDKHLLITVALVDDLGNAVSGASVSIDLFRDGSPVGSATGTTGTDGTVTFSLKNAPSGTYTTTVTDVTADGLTFDGFTPANEFPKP